ncbi:MAG: DUF2256 domain-containing protein [Halioglobus sp.]|nr:DUF2256 domain-containing protein [Halioglobus sp.]
MPPTGPYRAEPVKKSDLPRKTCPVCNRPFAWRARWRNNWEQVVYCSRRCAGNRNRRPR